jgi:UDP-glucose 6-dehydrogenase
MRISIFGTCYVGFVTAVCFAKIGHPVVATDKDRGASTPCGRHADPVRTGFA